MDLLEGLTEEELEFAAQNGDNETRRDIARFPNTSLDTLHWLAQEGFVDEVEQNPMLLFFLENRDETALLIWYEIAVQAKEDRLEEFSRSALAEVRQGVADNVHVSPEILDRLSKDEDPDVQWSVASNPKTTPATLARLAEHKVANWRGQVARNANTPVASLVVLAMDDHYLVRHGVASNQSTPNDILAVLSDDKDEDVRLTAQQTLLHKLARKENPVVDLEGKTEEELNLLAQEGEADLQRAVAVYSVTSLNTLLLLAYKGFAEDVAQNPMFPLYQETGGDDVDAILFELSRQTKDVEKLEQFSRSAKTSIRVGVAGNRHAPRSILERLAEDDHADVRVTIAIHEHTPPEVLESLAEDDSTEVRQRLAGNHSTPSGVLAHLSNDTSWVVRANVANNPSTTRDILTHLAQDTHFRVRDIAFGHLDEMKEMDERKQNPMVDLDKMSEQELEQLARTGTDDEKRAVARHPNANLKTLLLLSSKFAEDVDQNPLLPLHTEGGSSTVNNAGEIVRILSNIAFQTKRSARLEELSTVVWDLVRQAVATNKNTPRSTLLVLAKDSNKTVRANVAFVIQDPEILTSLAKDPESSVRHGVANNVNTPADALAILAKEKLAQMRLAVARNKSASESTLKLLCKDADFHVTQAARATLAKIE